MNKKKPRFFSTAEKECFLLSDEGQEEILGMKAKGYTLTQIEEELGISHRTFTRVVKDYGLADKLGLGYRKPTGIKENKVSTRKGVIYFIYTKDPIYQYVGKATTYRTRMNQHLKGDLEIDRVIQKYEYETMILEECSLEELDQRELYYIDLFQTYKDKGFGGLNGTEGNQYKRYIVYFDWTTFDIVAIYSGLNEFSNAISMKQRHIKHYLEDCDYFEGMMFLEDYIFYEGYRNRQTEKYRKDMELKKIKLARGDRFLPRNRIYEYDTEEIKELMDLMKRPDRMRRYH